MTIAPVAPSAEAEESRRAAEAQARLDAFIAKLHSVCTAPNIRPRAELWPWGTRMQEQYNDRQDAAAEALLDAMRDELAGIEDVAERCLLSEAIIKAIDARVPALRYGRDIGLIVMLFQHYDGYRQYKIAKAALDAALNGHEIDAAEHQRRLAEIVDGKRSVRSDARWRPTSAGALARVSRGLVNSQMKPKIPASLGESLRARKSGPEVPTPTMEEAERTVEGNGRILRYCGGAVAKAGTGTDNEKTIIPPPRTLRNVVQEVRDASVDEILDGAPDGGLGWQNIVLAGALGLSGARVAQLRNFTG